MMQTRTVEIAVGAFVMAAVFAMVVLVVRVSGVTVAAGDVGYRVYAEFDDVAGLRVRGKVSMAGVTIGRVTGIRVDPTFGVAIVEMEIYQRAWPLTADTGARILTEGILGARYVGLMPGAEDETIPEGGYISDTQGALVLENLIGDFITRLGAS
jgi:phospholipid/cholesterol/gamma-HCH transport system substrate-binding protein